MVAPEREVAVSVLGSLSSGVVAIDAEGAVSLWNDAGRRILGCPDGGVREVLGKPCTEALAHQPTVARLLLDTLAGCRPLSRAELTLEGHDRTPTTVGFSLVALREWSGEADGAIRGAAMLFRDLTPFERADERERLQERLAALGQMAAGLAHEIRNPLAGMEVSAGLLQRRVADDPDSLELVHDLRGQLRRLAETVTASLEFVRPVALRRAAVDPVELVEEALVRAVARSVSPDEVERCYAEPRCAVAVDPDLLGAAVANLIVNACQAMEAVPGRPSRLRLGVAIEATPECGSPVRLGREEIGAPAVRPSRELCISVSDSGEGVPESLREKIFDPFFTTRESGSGIGLANVQKIATGHGGSISIETSREGSTFRLLLPVENHGVEGTGA